MIKVYILKIEPEYEDLYSEDKLYCKRITDYEVTAMVHIDGHGVPNIERGIYKFDTDDIPDNISEIENRIKSMYIASE